MRISDPENTTVCDERVVYERLLPLRGARGLELGCGAAEKTRAIARESGVASIVALEVDAIQHAKNLTITDLPNVTFASGGAEAIPASDASFDVVLMFKSLHHVPVARMDDALREIHRVLRPGGLAYLSEPVFAGAFNDIVRRFHDERVVREAAFAAIERAVEGGLFELVTEEFFSTPGTFASFAEFEARVLNVTHTNHRLSPALYAEVREAFERHLTPEGARFQNPIRVDLLRKMIPWNSLRTP
jgi:ubiquinone/menaquinone biosynthesis C-methylase UbiE